MFSKYSKENQNRKKIADFIVLQQYLRYFFLSGSTNLGAGGFVSKDNH